VQPLFQSEKKSITYSECVSVAFGILHAMRMRHIVICGLSGYEMFFHISSLQALISENRY
jgi:hypothetical protein